MPYRTKLISCVLGGLCLLAASTPAKASFVGDSVTVNYEWPALGDVLYPGGTSTVTSGGTTFDMSTGGVTAEVTNSSIVVTFPFGWSFSTSAKTFDGIVISDPSADITGISLGSTNITGYIASDLSFNSHDVYINFPYPPFASLDTGSTLTVDVLFAAPEPTPASLLPAGLLGVVLLNRRKLRISQR